MTLTVGSLFSGIGGFDLAASWLGWRTLWFSEIDPYCQRVLAHHWPAVPQLGDVTLIDWSTVDRPNILCGGFPCQPHSLAGKRKGSDDERDLWGEFARAIRDLRPRYVVAENVPGLLSSDAGRFFNRILSDLAALGYDAEWQVLSAADVGAPHLRERIWILAYPRCVSDGAVQPEPESGRGLSADAGPRGETLADAPSDLRPASRDAQSLAFDRRRTTLADADGSGLGVYREGDAGSAREPGRHAAGYRRTESLPDAPSGGRAVCGIAPGQPGHPAQLCNDVPDGDGAGCEKQRWPVPSAEEYAPVEFGRWWAVEPDVGRVAHGIPARVDRLTGLGNAIVPACAHEIFAEIEAREIAAQLPAPRAIAS